MDESYGRSSCRANQKLKTYRVPVVFDKDEEAERKRGEIVEEEGKRYPLKPLG